MPTTCPTPLHPLLRHNGEVLQEALDLVRACGAMEPQVYAAAAGPHLRHVIEHYDALLNPALPDTIDYDLRVRERALEQHPELAAQRLQRLLSQLQAQPAERLHGTVVVRGLAGRSGDVHFAVVSTWGRELVFAASHAVHHFALLRASGALRGVAVSTTFGVAPATVAHAMSLARAPSASWPTTLEFT